jgi:histidine phosphotransferase ChpT
VNVPELSNPAIDLRIVELLAARLCHDLIGPVAAVANGAELLADEDAEFARDAIALVEDSARKASQRLQFYRFAYGFTGGGVTGPPPHQLVAGFFEDGSVSCDYAETARTLPVERQKLACNMLAVAAEPLIRGGRLVLEADATALEVQATGEGGRLSPDLRAALSLAITAGELNSRTVGAYFTGLLARRLGFRIVIADLAGGFRLALATAG